MRGGRVEGRTGGRKGRAEGRTHERTHTSTHTKTHTHTYSPREDTQNQVEDKEGPDDDERDKVNPVPGETQGVVRLNMDKHTYVFVCFVCHVLLQ